MIGKRKRKHGLLKGLFSSSLEHIFVCTKAKSQSYYSKNYFYFSTVLKTISYENVCSFIFFFFVSNLFESV
jgi:hypothetical protein